MRDLAPMLARAFQGLDRRLSVLDVGCGISQVFEDLQRGGSQEWKKDGAAASAAAAASDSDTDADAAAVGGFEGEMIGLDYSPSVIAHLRATYPASKHPKLHWICADACHLLEDAPPAETKKKAKGKAAEDKAAAAAAADDDGASPAAGTGSGPPPLSAADRARFFRPSSFGLILDKATSDGMLCSDATALRTPLIYANVARLLAPGGLFVVASVNEPESGWFGEHVVSTLLAHSEEEEGSGGSQVRWDIEVHAPARYSDGEQGAPNVYVIRKTPLRAARTGAAQEQREGYSIKRFDY
jgi:SAM-dependent methyltransferase